MPEFRFDVMAYGVPPLYAVAALNDFGASVQLVTARWREETLYFLTGLPGRGKTYLAVAILRAWITERRLGTARAQFEAVPDLLANMRGAVGGGKPYTVSQMRSAILGLNALVLDDLCAGKTTDWTVETLYDILSYRINRRLSTVVTSNLSLQQVNEVEPRIASRLKDGTVIELGGKDRRGARATG